MCLFSNSIQHIKNTLEWLLLFVFIMSPLRKKRGHTVLQLLVGQSVDKAMSAHYLLTPLLESCHTCYSGCPLIKSSYWFSGHMVQGQTAGLGTIDVSLISFDPFAWKKRCSFDFLVTFSKVKVKTAGLWIKWLTSS